MTTFYLSIGESVKLVEFIWKVLSRKDIYIKPYGFTQTTLLLETNAKGYYTFFSDKDKDNIKACVEEFKRNFNLDEKSVKTIENLLKDIHEGLIEKVLIDSI